MTKSVDGSANNLECFLAQFADPRLGIAKLHL